jgi:hypothetical protein
LNLPPHVRVNHGRAYYVRKVAGKVRWTPLCRADEGEAAIRAAYEAVLNEKPRTVADILGAWLKDGGRDLRPRTRREYERQITAKLEPTLGKMLPENVKPSHIAQYLERRKGPIGNREIATLSTVFNWAMRQGWIDENPCRGTRRNRETPRRRYVEDDELAKALEATTPAFRRLMQAAYLTGLRQGDLRVLRKDQISEKGIQLAESKRGKRLVISWSDELKALVDAAVAASKCDRVFANTRGRPWTESAIQSARRRLGADFAFHDLRAKAESDHEVGLGLLSRYKRARRLTPVR